MLIKIGNVRIGKISEFDYDFLDYVPDPYNAIKWALALKIQNRAYGIFIIYSKADIDEIVNNCFSDVEEFEDEYATLNRKLINKKLSRHKKIVNGFKT